MSCQNSIEFGATRNPDQCAGRGIVSPGYRASISATRRSSSARDASGRDWSEAPAPNRDTRARLALPQVDDDDAEPTCRTDPAQRSLFP